MEKLIEKVENYFSENNNLILTKGEVIISKRGAFIMIDYLLEESGPGGCERYVLHEEGLGLETVLEIYGITSLEEWQRLSEAKLWERYSAGGAEVIFTNADGATLHFRKLDGRTKVSSLRLHYYNEVDEVFNKTEHFKEFIDKHRELIEGEEVKMKFG